MARLSAGIISLLLSTAATAGVVGTGSGTRTQALLATQIAAGGTVTFNCGGVATIPVNGLVIASSNPTVDVDGAGQITLDGTSTGNIVTIQALLAVAPTVTFRNITFTNGLAVNGGAISNAGFLTLNNATFTANNAVASGGAIYQNMAGGSSVFPGVDIQYSNFSGSAVSAGSGGAIDQEAGSLNILETSFSGCSASSRGGALYINGTVARSPLCTSATATSRRIRRGAGERSSPFASRHRASSSTAAPSHPTSQPDRGQRDRPAPAGRSRSMRRDYPRRGSPSTGRSSKATTPTAPGAGRSG